MSVRVPDDMITRACQPAPTCTNDGECPIPGHTTLYRTAEWNDPPLNGQYISTWREHR